MVFKRGKNYHFRFLFHGRPVQKSTKQADKDTALALEAAERSRLARVDGGLESPVSPITKRQHVTIGSLIDALEADYKLRNKMSPQNASNLKRVRKDFGSTHARDLTAEVVDAYVEKRVAIGARPATINRVTQLLGQAFKLAIERSHLARAPRIRRLSEKDNARSGFFEAAQFRAVLANLPGDLRDFALFGYLTAWRKAEIASLTWEDVEDGVVRLRGINSKDEEPRVVVLEGELAEVIVRRKQMRLVDGRMISFVFHRAGDPVREFRRSWRTACKLAGCPGKLFHDLRRTSIRNMVRAGVSEKVAMSISGHRTRSVFDRYNIVNEQDLRDAMQQVQRYHQAASERVVALAVQ